MTVFHRSAEILGFFEKGVHKGGYALAGFRVRRAKEHRGKQLRSDPEAALEQTDAVCPRTFMAERTEVKDC